jgi:lipoate-protein ligase B
MHGFSLNVDVDPRYFENIISCGLKGYAQISINNLTEEDISVSDVKKSILLNFSNIFKYPVSSINI